MAGMSNSMRKIAEKLKQSDMTRKQLLKKVEIKERTLTNCLWKMNERGLAKKYVNLKDTRQNFYRLTESGHEELEMKTR